MRIVQAGYEIMDPFVSEGILKRIEKVARTCYKSEDKIKEGSAEKMVRALARSEHYAMLEHGIIIMETDERGYILLANTLELIKEKEGEVPYLRYTPSGYSGRYVVSGNCRAWLEYLTLCRKHELGVGRGFASILLEQDKYRAIFGELEVIISYKGNCKELTYADLTAKEKLIHGDITVKYYVDRGISHEIVRHRKASYAQESTRYCNYGKAGDVTFIRPCYFEEGTVEMDNWVDSCMRSEKDYLALLEMGRTPQEARGVLNTSLKTEVVMTANLKEWKHFFNLRALDTTGKAHPQIKEVAIPLLVEFKEMEPEVFADMEVDSWVAGETI